MNVSKSSDSKSSSSKSKSEPKKESKPESKPASSSTSSTQSNKPAASASNVTKTKAGQAWGGKSGFDAKPAQASTSLKLTVTSGSPKVGAAPAGAPLSVTSTLGAKTLTAPGLPGAQVPAPQQDSFLESVGSTLTGASNTIGNTLAGASNWIGDTLAGASNTLGTQLSQAANTITHVVYPPAAQQTPPPPSFTGTVTVTGNTMTPEEKIAAGALKLDPNVDPKTYDGMYIGSDGYAYPPDKFKVTDVPPFAPANPTTSPPQTTYFVNGINTTPDGAAAGAADLANLTGTNVVPIYNATQGGLTDAGQTGLDRIGVGSNKAADTLANLISTDLAHDRKVNVIGYSQGSAIVSHALEIVEGRISDMQGGFLANLPVLGDANREARERLMGNINVVGIGGAGKNFPPGPQYTFYVNRQDPVPNLLGVHPFNPVTDPLLSVIGSNPVLSLLNGGGAGYSAPGATVHLIDDPAQGGISPHYLETYLSHIQPSTSAP